jgi:phosphohistidine swiveling domain-containing protein
MEQIPAVTHIKPQELHIVGGKAANLGTVAQAGLIPIPPGDDVWDREHDQPPHPYDVWTRTNLGENLPFPITPLTEVNFPLLFGLNNESSEQRPQLTRRLYGRLYFNEGAMMHNFTEEMGLPASWLHKMWGSRPQGTQAYNTTFRPLRLLRKLFSLVASSFKAQKKEKTPHHTPKQFFAQIDQWVNEFLRRDLGQLNDGQLWNEGLPTWSKRGAYAWSTNLRFSIRAAVSYGLLERIVRWWTHKDLAQDLVTGLSAVYSAEVGPALWQMAHMAQEHELQDIFLTHEPIIALDLLRTHKNGHLLIEQLDIFLVRHGHRCPNELEMRNPRWAEAPEQIIELVTSYLRAGEDIDPLTVEAHQRQRRTAAVTTMEKHLDLIRRAIFRILLKQAQQAVITRDNSRYIMAKFIFPMRKVYAELGRRWAESGWLRQIDDIFFLTPVEIENVIKNPPITLSSVELQTCVEQRRLAYEFWFTIVAPEAVGADGLPIIDQGEHPTLLKGTAASGGCICGHARIVQTIQEAMQLGPDDILVTMATDPGWTPIFPLIGGMILEIGGQLSHGAIVAREYGIPAVVNVPGATRLIRNGQLIEVDGSKGLIKIY